MKQYVRFVDLKDEKSQNVKHLIVDQKMFPSLRITLETYGMGWKEVQANWNYPLHEHQSFEINYVTDGVQIFTVNGVEYTQRAGDMILVRPGDIHCSRAGTDRQGRMRGFKYFVMHFFMEDAAIIPYLHGSNQSFHPADSKVAMSISPLLQHFVKTLKSEPNWGLLEQLQLRSDFYSFLAALVSGLSGNPSGSQSHVARRIAERIEQAINHRFDRGDGSDIIESDVGIQKIAEEIGISTSYCYKAFKQVYQTSPRQYISARILDEAKHLLNNPDMSVEDISFQLKYHDTAHFSRQFKRWTGFYPTEYRKQVQRVDH